MPLKGLFIAGLFSLGLAGCGETPLEQAAIGAGAGVVGAAVLDTNLGTGAAIGAIGSVAYCQTYPERC